jgi:hypothetical protein
MTTLYLVLSGRAVQTREQPVKKKQHTGTALAGLTLATFKMLIHASLERSPSFIGNIVGANDCKCSWDQGLNVLSEARRS